MKQFLEVGKIVNTHGIRGEVKLQPWCNSVDFLKQFQFLYLDESGKMPVELLTVRAHKNCAVLKLAGVDSIDAAEKYKNRILYCNRDDAVIDEDAQYIQDLIGCAVKNAETAEVYGKVTDVVNYGASDILEIEDHGKKRYVPLIDEIVINTDCENGVIEIIPMKGLFDEN